MNNSITASSSTSCLIRPRLSLKSGSSGYSNRSSFSIRSIGSRRGSTASTRRLSSGFPKSVVNANKTWVKLQVDSIYFDLKNDEYEIKLSGSHVMSFDFASRSCSVRIPAGKIQMDATIHEKADDEYEDHDFDKLLEEIDSQSSDLQLSHIKSDWNQLQSMLNKRNYATNGSHKRSKSRLHSCPSTIEQCPPIQRIIFILKLYSLYLKYKTCPPIHIDDAFIKSLPSSVSQVMDALDDYDAVKLLNDYHHIKRYHANNNELHDLQQYIKRNIAPCEDVKQCISCNRNQEDNEIYKHLEAKTRRDLYIIHDDLKDCSDEEMQEINLQKYMDIIHSTLIHQTVSENMSDKFTTRIKKSWSDHNSMDSAHDEHKNKVLPLNTKISYSSIYAMDDISVEDESYFDGVTVISPDDNTDSEALYNLSDVRYKFGESFSYWNKKSFDYVAAKHKDLKTELLCHGMLSADYKCVYFRAMDYLKSEIGTHMKCRRQFSWMHRSVNYSDHITLQHIIVLMIHTNYIKLRDRIIQTLCKMSDEHEKLQAVKQKHAEIATYCRLLKESIFCFGDCLGDRSRFFHGIDCKLLFSEICFSFNTPISATIKYSIAPISSHGICMKFGKPIFANQKNYYLDVSDISQFPDEKERLVFGGEAMGFMDIIYNGHSHAEQVMSMRLFQMIVTGHWFTNNKDLMKEKYQRRIIKMIHLFIVNDNAISSNYVVEMFRNIIIAKLRDRTMWVNREEIELCVPELRELIVNKFHSYLTENGYNTNLRFCDVLEMNLSKKQIEASSFRKSIYSNLYTFKLNKTHKMSFVFRCFKKYDEQRKESMFRGFIAIKYLPKGHEINKIEMRYGLYFPQKEKLSKWEKCTLSPTNLYKGSSLFHLAEIKHLHDLQIKICFQIINVT